MDDYAITARRILDTALELAERCGWERLRLYDVASRLEMGLDTLVAHYPDKDALVEAWFDRADQALMARAGDASLAALTPARRLEDLLIAWFESLAAHRAVTGQMLLYKLEPGHVHLQVLGLLRISRTVQGWREAARRDNHALRRIAEESLLTAVYLRSVVHWLRHPEVDSARLRAHLRRSLRSGPLQRLLRA